MIFSEIIQKSVFLLIVFRIKLHSKHSIPFQLLLAISGGASAAKTPPLCWPSDNNWRECAHWELVSRCRAVFQWSCRHVFRARGDQFCSCSSQCRTATSELAVGHKCGHESEHSGQNQALLLQQRGVGGLSLGASRRGETQERYVLWNLSYKRVTTFCAIPEFFIPWNALLCCVGQLAVLWPNTRINSWSRHHAFSGVFIHLFLVSIKHLYISYDWYSQTSVLSSSSDLSPESDSEFALKSI